MGDASADSSGPAITVYKLDGQKPLAELERQARTLAIPDVVVEYIRDSLKQEGGGAAFDAGEVIVVRTQSSINLREDGREDAKPVPAPDRHRLCSSMPRSARRPGSPKLDDRLLLAVDEPSLSASSSSLGRPRSVPPSPDFGYRPLESETSAVYAIIAPARYLADDQGMMDVYNLEREKSFRKFEHNAAPQPTEGRRRRLQCATDACSLLFLIPGIMIAILTPICLIPMFLMPLKYYIPLILVFVASGIASVVSLAFSGFLGNVVWHYDPERGRLRPRMHCGRGPRLHFWGGSFFAAPDLQPLKKAQIV